MRLVRVLFAGVLAVVSLEAKADAVSPEKAAEMLAHAWMVDNRCNVLGNDDRDRLTNLVARAEISLAEKKSVAAARAAIGRGRASGTAAPCDSQSAKSVNDVLLAARSAASAVPTELPVVSQPEIPAAQAEPAPQAAVMAPAVTETEAAPDEAAAYAGDDTVLNKEPPAKAVVVRKRAVVVTPHSPQKPARVAIKRAPVPARQVAKKTPEKKVRLAVVQSGAANGYAVTAEAYYKELRCRRKSMQAVRAMYAQVLRQHRAAVSARGKSAVRALLRAAEARAARGAC